MRYDRTENGNDIAVHSTMRTPKYARWQGVRRLEKRVQPPLEVLRPRAPQQPTDEGQADGGAPRAHEAVLPEIRLNLRVVLAPVLRKFFLTHVPPTS
jgi:hypothetical protein